MISSAYIGLGVLCLITDVSENCFTSIFDKHDDMNELSVKCSTREKTSSIAMYDSNKQYYTNCSLDQQICNTKNGKASVNLKNKNNELQVKYQVSVGDDYEKMWTCVYNNETFLMNVSILEGFIEQTKVHLRVQESGNVLNITCWTCHDTFGSSAEFLVNGITEDTLRFTSNVCYHKGQECNQLCSCSKTRFNLVYQARLPSDIHSIACKVGFSDGNRKCKSSQTTTASRSKDGKAFIIYQSAPILRQPCPKIKKKNRRSGTTETTNEHDKKEDCSYTDKTLMYTLTSLCVSFFVIIVVLVIIIVILCWKLNLTRRNESNKNRTPALRVDGRLPGNESNTNRTPAPQADGRLPEEIELIQVRSDDDGGASP